MVTVLSEKYGVPCKIQWTIGEGEENRCYRTGFVEVYAGVALQKLRLLLVAEIENKDFLGQRHVFRLFLRGIRDASSTSLAPRFHGLAAPLADSLQSICVPSFTVDKIYRTRSMKIVELPARRDPGST